VRILVDYRPALRERTGVGEYIHQLARAYTAAYCEEVLLFTSSWKDRPAPHVADQTGARVIDRRIPVRILNYLWHRLEWPPVEILAGNVDITHSAHPLLMPARNAAQMVTIHDLFFLAHAQDTSAEIRRDYPVLAASHARRAHAVITSTQYGRSQIIERLGVAAERIYVCPPGAPAWRTLGRQPNVPSDGCILFMGTLEPRKNIGVLLDAYQQLLDGGRELPRMVLAGRATAAASTWVARINSAPLSDHVTHIGYVDDQAREDLYRSARVLVLPSLDEGFGLPALEAMAAGRVVIASRVGGLADAIVHGENGLLFEPGNHLKLKDKLLLVLSDDSLRSRLSENARRTAAAYDWTLIGSRYGTIINRALRTHDATGNRRIEVSNIN